MSEGLSYATAVVLIGLALLGYSLVNLVGVGLFGLSAWFRHGELFAVFLRLIALMAPVEVRVDRPAPSRVAWALTHWWVRKAAMIQLATAKRTSALVPEAAVATITS